MIRDWFITLRAANTPTVWSNVLLGAGLSVALPTWSLGLVAAAVTCMYLAGMALNDAVDVGFDRANDSTRPVATGRIAAGAALSVGCLLLVLGWVLGVLAEFDPAASPWTDEALVVLAVAVSMYQWVHRMSALAAAACMAVCRFCVPVIAALSVSSSGPSPVVWIAAGAVALWTGGIICLGRGERGGEPVVRGGVTLCILAALATVPVSLLATQGAVFMVGPALLIVLGAWVPAVWRQYAAGRPGTAVAWAIAGLAVLDAGLLLVAQAEVWAGAAMVCAAATLGLQRLGGAS